ncbi:MAG: hypothetical protein IKO49_03900 [Bacilli bacterium]|nr:hypothetical protein [Bacilli bacterium]
MIKTFLKNYFLDMLVFISIIGISLFTLLKMIICFPFLWIPCVTIYILNEIGRVHHEFQKVFMLYDDVYLDDDDDEDIWR